jgi:tRNA1Val (adenine37-N6)-methyltransferase
MSGLTTDTFFKGRLKVKQPKTGYRFSIDAVLLAHSVNPRSVDTIVDLGTGCGIIPLILAFRHPRVRLYGIEIQSALADLALSNVAVNGLEPRITILQQDLKDLTPRSVTHRIHMVVSNPPFRKVNSGRMNPHAQRAIARHEIMTTLQEVIAAASRMLSPGGRFITIYAAERLADMLTRMQAAQLEPKQVRMVHSTAGREAKVFLVEGVKGANPGLIVGAPLIIYNQEGTYTEEVAQMFE